MIARRRTLPPQSLRVLVVDDDPLQVALVERILRAQGMEVATAFEALGVSNRIREFLPDVVLLDVRMPALTGDHLLVVARRHVPKETRFVLYSALADPALAALARESNADGWISKNRDVYQLPAQLLKIARQ